MLMGLILPVAFLASSVIAAGAAVAWSIWYAKTAGLSKTGTRLMLGGLGLFIFGMPSCIGCSVVVAATAGSDYVGLWVMGWFAYMGLGIFMVVCGLILKAAASK